MANLTLAQSYLLKAKKRLKVLDLLFAEEAYSDVIRELAFSGDVDFIPTAEYSKEDAERAISDSRFVVEVAEKGIPLV